MLMRGLTAGDSPPDRSLAMPRVSACMMRARAGARLAETKEDYGLIEQGGSYPVDDCDVGSKPEVVSKLDR